MSIETLIHRLGICSIYKGYSYLVYAVELVVRNEEYLLYITKALYPDIAKYFHSTSSRIERSLRTVITNCWNEGNRELLNRIAGYELQRKPTTGEFIALLAYYVKNHDTEDL